MPRCLHCDIEGPTADFRRLPLRYRVTGRSGPLGSNLAKQAAESLGKASGAAVEAEERRWACHVKSDCAARGMARLRLVA